jgi:hypothetical protein
MKRYPHARSLGSLDMPAPRSPHRQVETFLSDVPGMNRFFSSPA